MAKQNFFRNKLEDSTNLNVGDSTKYALPSGAGYDDAKFRADIRSIFTGDDRADLKTVREAWEDYALYEGNQYGKKFVTIGEARECVKELDRFFDKLQNGRVKDALMRWHDGDVEQSAQTLLDWCEYHAQHKTKANFAAGLADALENIEKSQEREDFKRGCNGQFGAHDDKIPMHPAALRVKELLPKVRRKYDFAAVRSYEYETTIHPEDDVNVRNMESYGEVMRIPKVLLGAEDDEFYLRMATKSFPVLEYTKAIPKPKKFVILIDISGSMQEPMDKQGYLRCEYAQATGIALAEQAQEGGNQCEVIYFDGSAKEPITGTPLEIQNKLLAEQFQGSSTNFENAFRAADKTNADSAVIITDGHSSYIKPPKMPLMTLIMSNSKDVSNERLQKDSYRYEVVS
jgi:uncharacterized protein with von Willebrand factor type A (vWA) domain